MQIFINNFMEYLTQYYKNLCEQLQERINLLEAKVKKKKKAKKDYDGDGTVESSTDEWKGSRDRAIKQAMSEAKINRPTHTIIGDVFRSDEQQDRRIRNRTQVMSDLHALRSFEGASDEERAAAEKVLKDMETTDSKTGTIGTDATTQDVFAARRALKGYQGSDAFKGHAAKTLSGFEDTGMHSYNVGSNDMDFKRVYKRNTDVGTGLEALAKGIDDTWYWARYMGNPAVNDMTRQIAIEMNPSGKSFQQIGMHPSGKVFRGTKVTPFTSSTDEFRARLENPAVQKEIGVQTPRRSEAGQAETAAEITKNFPADFESTILGKYVKPRKLT
jgi:hypothetical protein